MKKITKKHLGKEFRFFNKVFYESFYGKIEKIERFQVYITVNGHLGVFSRDEIRIIGLSWK